MAKKAISFMKKEGRGFIKVWESRQKDCTTIRQAWTDGKILVMDGHNEFNLDPGSYIYDAESGLIKSGKFPKLKDIIPKMKGYHKTEAIYDDGLLRLSKEITRLLVTLKGNGVKAFLDHDYYQYFTEGAYADWTWKVKGGEDPILFYLGKELAGLVMPIKV